MGLYYSTSAAIPGMIERKFGRITSISSYSAEAGNIGQANYAASKGGIIAFTRTIALELAKYNITANCCTRLHLHRYAVEGLGRSAGANQSAHSHGAFRQRGRRCQSDGFPRGRRGLYYWVTGETINANGGITRIDNPFGTDANGHPSKNSPVQRTC
jgi:NAD(P)-dependent dehydrogenase (short-subunit alcohol dehydrogenase family)